VSLYPWRWTSASTRAGYSVLGLAHIEGVLARDAILLVLVVAWFQLMLVVELSVLGHVLELSNQKARGFLVPITILR
jgi:hypothetical protein